MVNKLGQWETDPKIIEEWRIKTSPAKRGNNPGIVTSPQEARRVTDYTGPSGLAPRGTHPGILLPQQATRRVTDYTGPGSAAHSAAWGSGEGSAVLSGSDDGDDGAFLTTRDLGPGFNSRTFNPLRPQLGIPGLEGSFPTLGMLQYLTNAEQARRQSALQATQFGLEVGRQPLNWLDWWRLTQGPARATVQGTPLPSFIGTNGETAQRFTFPTVNYEGTTLTNPSAQQYSRMSPTARQGLAGLYRALGIPLEDLFYSITAPTQGLRGVNVVQGARR